MTARARAIAEFLDAAGWASAERRPLAADASFRRYERLWRDGASRVLMDAPPPQENVRAFHQIARSLIDLGLSAPRPLEVDEAAGLMLLDDFGDRTFTRALAEGVDEAFLYRLAIDSLIALHQRWRPELSPGGPESTLPPYDDARLIEEALLLPDWLLPAPDGTAPASGSATPEEVPSPTFTLLQTYERAPAPVWHFDLYRVARPDEAYELGFEEALDGGITLIEWAERLGPLLPAERLEIRFEFAECADARRTALIGTGSWDRRLRDLAAP
jgi:hypothetical protein